MPQDKKRNPIKVELDPSHIHELINGSDSSEEESPRLRPEVTRNYPLAEDQPLYVDPKSTPIQALNFDQLPLKDTSPTIEPNIPSIPKVPKEQSTADRLKGLLSAPPLQSDFKPSKLRKFGAAVAGGLTGAAYGPRTGMEVASNIADQPYREQYQDWLTKTGALEKQSQLDISKSKAESGGLSALGSYLRAQGAIDPELQANIASKKTTATEAALEPGREAKSTRDQAGKEAIEGIRRDREQKLETTRQAGREVLETNKQKNKQKLSDEQITSREKIAKDNITSRENIARLNRELKKKVASTAAKNQRVPPSQQYLGKAMAENEISQLISNKDEFDALFSENKDATSGRISYSLKPENEIDDLWKAKYKARKGEINELLSKILKSSYNPSRSAAEEDSEDDYSIEETP